MHGSWDREILGCDGVAGIIDVAYEFELGAVKSILLRQ